MSGAPCWTLPGTDGSPQIWLHEQLSTKPNTMLQVKPKGDLVLAKVAEAEDKTTGGILLPDSAQQKPTSGVHAIHVPLATRFTHPGL